MMKSPKWSSQKPNRPYLSFFQKEKELEHALTVLGEQYCTLKENPFGIPYTGYYFDVNHKRDLLIQYKACIEKPHPRAAITVFFQKLGEECQRLIKQENVLFNEIVSYSGDNIIDQHKNINDLLKASQLKLTKMEGIYYFGLKCMDAENLAMLKEDLQKTIQFSLSLYIRIEVKFQAKKLLPEAKKLWQKLFSFFESLRCSVVLTEVIEAEDIFNDAFYDLLYKSYRNALKDIFVNVFYVQEISNMYLLSLMISQETIEQLCPFKMQFLYLKANYRVCDAYVLSDECTVYLQNACEYLDLLLDSLFQNTDISFLGYMSDDQLPRVAEGRPQIQELEKRIENIAHYHHLFLKITEIYKQTQGFNERKQILDRQGTIIQKKKEEISAMKASLQSKAKIATVAKAHFAPKQIKTAPLPPAQAIQGALKISIYDRPTLRISPEEQALNKQLKQQSYEEHKQEPVSSAASSHEDNHGFDFSFAIFSKPIKAKLDHAMCIKAMGEAAFNQVLPKLNALLIRGKVTAGKGQGIKLVSYSEKILLGLSPKDAYWFKLKLMGTNADLLHVYGKVFSEDGEQKIKFDHVEFGNVHQHSNRIYHPPLPLSANLNTLQEDPKPAAETPSPS